MKQRARPLAALVVVLLGATPVVARLMPAPGGRATVALPGELLDDTLRAHLYAPLLEDTEGASRAARLAHPPLPGLEGWRSDVLLAVEEREGGREWRLTPLGVTSAVLAGAVRYCLEDESLTAPWPALVLRALDLGVVVDSDGQHVTVRFDRAVGVAPELFSGCLLESPGAAPTGPYTQMGGNLLAARPSGPSGPPLLGIIELRDASGPGDLVGGSPQAGVTSALLAPFPDVIVLLQSQRARDSDVLRLKGERGWSQFHRDLGADLLLAVYWAGRGRAAEDLLPPGVAPARPLPQVAVVEPSGPLALSALPAGAPRLPVYMSPADNLLAGVVERMAVLLRSSGHAVHPLADSGAPLDDGVALLRWRPRTTDPALALLALAGARKEVRDATPSDLLKDARLLSSSLEQRVAASLALERAWLEQRVVVPLMTADRWFAVDPALRGVRVRADGVPLLDDAYWGGRE